MYDVYMKGSYQFTETTDLKNFKVIDSEVKMNFHPRHGTIIPITRHELLRITDEWGKPTELGALPNNPVLPGFHAKPGNHFIPIRPKSITSILLRTDSRVGEAGISPYSPPRI